MRLSPTLENALLKTDGEKLIKRGTEISVGISLGVLNIIRPPLLQPFRSGRSRVIETADV